MTQKDYKVGYCKPPLETRFQKGVCPNPAGRGRKLESSALGQIERILYKPLHLTANKKGKKVTLAEFIVRKLISSALQGNPHDALHLLRIYRHDNANANEKLIVYVEGGVPGLFKQI